MLPECSTMQDPGRVSTALIEMRAMSSALAEAMVISSTMEDESRIATLWCGSLGAIPIRLARVSRWDNLAMTATIAGRRAFGMSAPTREGFPDIGDVGCGNLKAWIDSTIEIVEGTEHRPPSACPRDEDGFGRISDMVGMALYAQGLEADGMVIVRSEGAKTPTQVEVTLEDGAEWRPSQAFARKLSVLGRASLELEIRGFDDPLKASVGAVLSETNGLHVAVNRPESIAMDIDHDVTAMDLLRDMESIGAEGPWFERVEP